MSRTFVHVRDALPEDAESMVAVWSDFRRGGTDREPCRPAEDEAAAAIARIATEADERLLIGFADGEPAGAAHLIRARVSPIHSETAIWISHLHVVDRSRRRGVGRALIEAAVSWAEEKDTSHLLVGASVHSRDANRFMARLGLGQVAIVRGASIPALRAKLPVEPPAGAMVTSRNHRSVGQVLAQRRLQRRAQSKTS